MAFEFLVDTKEVFKVLFTEKEKQTAVIQDVRECFNELDRMKVEYKTPINNTADILAEFEQCETPYESVYRDILLAEESMIKLMQFRRLLKMANVEIGAVLNQINIRMRMKANKTLTNEEVNSYVPLGLQDLNEVTRYLMVWDIESAVMSKKESIFGLKHLENTVNDSVRLANLEREGYKDYVLKLNSIFENTKTELQNQITNVFFANINNVKTSLYELNRCSNYTPIHDLDYNDGSREPIGSEEVASEFDKTYDEMFDKYKRDIAKKQAKKKNAKVL